MFFLLICLCILLYYYGMRKFSYWSDRNVKHKKPIPFIGNNFDGYTMRKNASLIAANLYEQFPGERFVGFYRGGDPELIIRDPDIIRHVLTADFQYFHDRGLGRDVEIEPMLNNLFSADGDIWKLLRQRLTPAFTSGKLKNMFPLIVECTKQMQNVADDIADSGEPCDVRELLARFTTDFIGSCGFGIKMNSMDDASSEFRALGKRMFTITPAIAFKAFVREIFPSLFNRVKLFDQSVEDDIVGIVKKISDQRNGEPIGRNDFIDMLLELKKQGKIVAESFHDKNADGTPKLIEKEMDLTLIAAQCFIFFAAGFETSSSSSSYALHELAYNPDSQIKAQEEIDRVLAKYGGKLCYDAVKEMIYLESAFKEGLRKFPALGVLNRTCTKRYQLPGTNVWIDKGVKIVIPVAALQNDEQYFENPEQFDPSRFFPEADKNRHKYTYLPFGEGSRNCIGSRLGLMQSMAGLAAILSRYSVAPAATSRRQLEVDPFSNVVQSVKGGVPLLLRKRDASRFIRHI